MQQYLAFLSSVAEVTTATRPLSVPISDPDDIPIISPALAAEADLFVTGDKALLELRLVHEMPVVSPGDVGKGCRDNPTLFQPTAHINDLVFPQSGA